MNRFLIPVIALLFLAIVGCTDQAQTQSDADGADHAAMAEMSDTDKVLEALAVNGESFLAMIDGLSDEQLAFKESPERWSIAGVAEHIVTSEAMFGTMIEGILASEPYTHSEADSAASDAMVVAVMTDRSQKYQATESAHPTGKFSSSDQIVAAFEEVRAATEAMVQNSDVELRSVAGEHPAMGMLDGAQWVLFVAAHADRHLDQMQQVKDDTSYPANAM